MKLSFTLAELEGVAEQLIAHSPTKVIRIDGDLGAGKTTLIAAAVKFLGVKDPANSPTFSIINTYEGHLGPIYHFDFYRLNHPDEALDIGLEEYLDSSYPCFVEWGEKVAPHLPLKYDHFNLTQETSDSRILEKINS